MRHGARDKVEHLHTLGRDHHGISMNVTLCTLFQGSYHYGLAALANSLAAAGYTGKLWAGYRGALPPWMVDSPSFDRTTGEFEVVPSFKLCMVELTTPLHFTYYKATFIRDVLEKHAPEASHIAYIDPDIVVRCSWATMSAWFTDDGISLVEDVNCSLPARHPKRLQWAKFFAAHGEFQRRPIDRYYNGGFIALARAQIGFVELLRRLCDLVWQYNKQSQELKSTDVTDLFYSTDQDALNFAVTACEVPLNTAGPEAMDFAPGGYYFSHAIGHFKPWLGRHIGQALRGHPPTAANKVYFRFANSPIKVYEDGEFARRRLEMKVAAAIGRVYKKS